MTIQLPDIAAKIRIDDSALDDAKGRFSGFGDNLQAFGRTATRAITLPFIGFGALAIKEAGEADKAMAQTGAVIQSTGGSANVTVGHVKSLADRLGKLAGVEGETVQAGQNMLLTFTNVRNETGKGNDVFDQASKTLLDMSTALGVDTAQGAIQLGKALHDPIKGVSALQRVGVTFTEAQKAQIKALVESGDTMGAQKVILAELNKEFGGSAAAAGRSRDPFEKLSLAGKDLAESVGTVLIPKLQGLVQFASGLAEKFQALSPRTQELILTIAGIAAAVGPVILIGAKLVTAFSTIGTAFGALTKLLMANPWVLLIAAVIALVVIIVKNWDTIKETVGKALDWIGDKVGAVWQWIKNTTATIWNNIKDFFVQWWPVLLGIATGGVGLIIGMIVKNWDEIKAFTAGIWNGIKDFLANIWNGIRDTAAAVFDAVRNFFENIWNGIRDFLSGVWNGIKHAGESIFNGLAGGLRDIWYGVLHVAENVWNNLRNFLSGLWDGLRNIAVNAFNGLRAGIANVWIAVVHAVHEVWNNIRWKILDTIGDAKDGAYRAIRSIVGFFRDLWHEASEWIARLIRKIKDLPFVPGSPIPMVVWAQQTRRGVNAAFQGMARDFERLGLMNGDLAWRVAAPAAAGLGAARVGNTYNITVSGTMEPIDEDRLVTLLQRAERLAGFTP